MSVDDDRFDEAAGTLALLRARGWMAATAESCTGGLIAASLTAVAGSSDVFDRGFVTYSNAAKTEVLGVHADLIATQGAVSAAVALAMADAALARSHATVAVSVTGIAGPAGGTAEKPVGLVWFGCACRGAASLVVHQVFPETARKSGTQLSASRLACCVRQPPDRAGTPGARPQRVPCQARP